MSHHAYRAVITSPYISGEAYVIYIAVKQRVNAFDNHIILGWKTHIRKVAATQHSKPRLRVANEPRTASIFNKGEGWWSSQSLIPSALVSFLDLSKALTMYLIQMAS
ncbi:hypothetical protein XENORESO_008160 [Xenotaenia resolanae]|uniref:Uncharacterized protein n=1 Tax=Xenotaenia resolanae TaxID=208358 RepID=A0ABV0VX73_9TELE